MPNPSELVREDRIEFPEDFRGRCHRVCEYLNIKFIECIAEIEMAYAVNEIIYRMPAALVDGLYTRLECV